MKTFKNLKFTEHPIKNIEYFSKQAVMFFPNGYGISVISGKHAYSNVDKPYEIAVLFGDEKESQITYNTPITTDFIGWNTEEDVTEIMFKIQNL